MEIFDLFKPSVKKLKEKRDVKGLIKALRHKQSDIQSEASEALIGIGEPAIDPLIQSLKDGNDKNVLQLGGCPTIQNRQKRTADNALNLKRRNFFSAETNCETAS